MPWAYRGAGAFGSKVEVLIQRGDLPDDDPVDPSEPRTDEVVQSGMAANEKYRMGCRAGFRADFLP
jgi:hypothetical protein